MNALDQTQLDDLIVSLCPARMPGAFPTTIEATLSVQGIRVDLSPFGPLVTRLVSSGRVVLRGGKTRPFQLVKGVSACVAPTATPTDQQALL